MTDDDFDWTARLWLEDGPTAIPGHALQTALDEIHVTRQRRHPWSAWRTSNVNTPMKVAVGAAAVLLVAVIGVNLLPEGSNVGGGGPAATATPSPTPAPTPTPMPLPEGGQIEMGVTYAIGQPFPIPMDVTIPAGDWTGNIGGPYAVFLGANALGAQMAFTLDQTLFADPCLGGGPMEPQPGPTVDDLATALASIPVLTATTPTEVTVDGHHGQQITLTAPADLSACLTPPVDGLRVWQLPLGAELTFAPGQATTFWILDVDGQRLVITSDVAAGRPASDQAAAQAVVDSLRIKPAE